MLIQLTDIDYRKFYVKVEQIEAILPMSSGTQIDMVSGKSHFCEETVKEVSKLIEEAVNQ